MLQSILTLIDHDEIKSTFSRHHDLLATLQAVKNCSSLEACFDSVWNMMTENWNDLVIF